MEAWWCWTEMAAVILTYRNSIVITCFISHHHSIWVNRLATKCGAISAQRKTVVVFFFVYFTVLELYFKFHSFTYFFKQKKMPKLFHHSKRIHKTYKGLSTFKGIGLKTQQSNIDNPHQEFVIQQEDFPALPRPQSVHNKSILFICF